MAKNKRAGLPSIDSNSIPSGIVIAARPGDLTPLDFACGVAIPSPSPVVPLASRARTSFRYCALSLRFPPLSIKSTRCAIASCLSLTLARRSMLAVLSNSVTLMSTHSFKNNRYNS